MAQRDEPLQHRLVRNQPSRMWAAQRALSMPRAGGVRRACLVALAFLCSTLFVLLIGGGLLFLGLSRGPIDLGLGQRIAAALAERVGGGYSFAIGDTAVETDEHGPSLVVRQFSVKDRNGRTIMAAPRAGISVDLLALAVGTVAPKRLDVQDILLRVVRLEDGRVAMSAGADQSGPNQPSALTFNEAFPGIANHDTAPGAPPAVGTPAEPEAGAGASAPAHAAAGPLTVRSLTGLVDDLLIEAFDAGSPFRGLDRFGIKHGTLVIEDRSRQTSITYRNFTIDLDREANDSVFFTAGADGPAGHWAVSARVNRESDGRKLVDLAVDHLSLDELMLASGQRPAGFETDMPLSISLGLSVDGSGKLDRAEGRLSFGAGYFKLDDPDHEPAMVDGIDVGLRIDPQNGEIEFGAGSLKADQTTFKFGMRLAPPAKPDDPWHLTGDSTGTFGAERPGELPIAIDQIHMDVDAFPDQQRVLVKTFTAKGPNLTFRMNAEVTATNPGVLVTGSMETGKMPGMDVIRLWPNWIAAAPRAWFLANLRGGSLDYGRARVKLTDVDLKTMRNQHSPPDDHVHIEFGISNASMVFMNGVPPLRALDGTGVITGDTLNFAATRGEVEVSPGHKLSLSDGSFTIPSTDPKPTPAVIALRVTGGVDAVADLLSRDALKPFADLPLDADSVQGQVDGRLTVNLRLGPHIPPEDTKVGVVATVKDMAVDHLIGKEGLEAATMNIVADKSGLHATGSGRLFGGPAQIDIKKPPAGAPSEAVVQVTLDDAARAKAGFGFGHALTGPVAARIATSLTAGEKSKANVELDFTKAAFDSPLPGLKKAAGKPSKADFTVTQGNNRIALDQIVFDAGSTSVRGSAELDANGGFQAARLSQFRLSPGDDMKVDIAPAGDGLKIVVRGTNIDARPFLKTATGGDSSAPSDGPTKDLDLDLHANLLTGQNAQAISNADVRLQRHGNQFRRVQMTGRLGRGPVTVNTVGQGAGATIVIATKDAGATLSFLDLYKRMEGGRLDTTLKFVDKDRLDGYAVIHDFTIKEDPAIKRLASEEIPSDSRNAGARIDSNSTPFSKLEAYFTRSGNRVDVRQGSMFGPQVGATVEGSIDFARDKVALSGTFVPIYGLNNLFSQIPVVGLILGGGAHEGLFALNYRIDGSASAPVLSFNPLSALAPGFLRKIFGAIDSAAQQGGEIPSSGRDRAASPAAPKTDAE